MKIVDRQTFLAMPRGTLFCKVGACHVQPLTIKLDTIGEDFVYRDVVEVLSESSDEFMDLMIQACDARSRDDLPLDWHRDMQRDGLFERDQMFGVLEHDELTAVIIMLTEARDGHI